MPGPCPTDASLEAFARGLGTAVEREPSAAHMRGCPSCQARYLKLALRSAADDGGDPTVMRRRQTTEVTPPTDPESSMEDTHVSGELSLSSITTSSINKGQALDRYVILDRLGSGGMGAVYAAWDPVLDRKVAMKVLRPDIEGSELGEELQHRLLLEAQSLAKLSHPNVVTIHDVGVAGDRVFLAMEFAEGRTLKQWMEQQPRPTWQAVLQVFLAAGEGLAAAHAQGITHRDFKPDNVVVGEDGRVRVMDFGLAHGQAAPRKDASPVPRTITQPGSMLGTPAYMSLEGLHGRPTDFRSDEFSFCVALYEAFYGVRPFEGATPGALAVEIDQNRVRPAPKDSKVPRRIHQLVLKGLRADAAERFQTLRALLLQLGRRRSNRERGLALASIAGLAVLAAGLTGLASYRARTRCAQVDERLRGVWDGKVKREVKRAFEATGKPWAAAAWRDVEVQLDDYSGRWLQQRRAACEGMAERDDEQLGQEIVCLSRRLSELEATSQIFKSADADVVERAVTTAGALTPLSSCRQLVPTARRKAEAETTRAELSAIKARLDAGKYAEAQTLANDLAARALASGDQGTVAESKLWQAVAKMRSGDARSADALVEESILAAALAQDDELQARSWVERVGFSAATGAPQDVDRWARFARAAVDRVGKPPELEASLANNLGVVAQFRGHFADAVEAHQRALALRRELLGERHPLVARSHSNLGTAFKGLGKLDDARAQYELALGIEERVLDPTHPQVADTLNNLGNVLQAQGSPTGARRALERALRIKEAAYGADSFPVAITLSNLAVLLLDLEDLPAADAALTRALVIKEKKAGLDALTVAISLTNLAQVRRAQRRWVEAAELDERALSIRKLRQGDRHHDLALNLTGLGEAQVQLQQLAAARAALEQALSLRPEPGPERAVTAYWLARTLPPTEQARRRALLDEAAAELPPQSSLRDDVTTQLKGPRRR